MYIQSTKNVKQKNSRPRTYKKPKIDNKPPDKELQTNSTQGMHNQLKEFNDFPFSKKAEDLLRRKSDKYHTQLISESTKLARSQGVDEVSAIHVERASNNLKYIPSNKFSRHIGTIGGIILGASISALLELISVEQCYSVPILIAVALAIISAIMVTWHIAKDL